MLARPRPYLPLLRALLAAWLALTVGTAPLAATAFATDKVKKAGKLAEGKAAITISSMTKGAKVFVDDKEVGEVPLAGVIEVEANQRHTVRVQKRGYTPFIDNVLPSNGQTVEVEADLVATGGFVKISSTDLRLKLQIVLDGQIVGTTPFDGDVAAGQHAVEARATGYLPETRTIDVKTGQQTTLEFALKVVPEPIIKEDKSVLSRWWFWTAIGAAVVGGVATSVVLAQDTHVAPKPASLTLVLGN